MHVHNHKYSAGFGSEEYDFCVVMALSDHHIDLERQSRHEVQGNSIDEFIMESTGILEERNIFTKQPADLFDTSKVGQVPWGKKISRLMGRIE